jgi:hypothetical protein
MVSSVKKWQALFFYVKNENPANELLNLPSFSLAPPTKMNWGYCHKPTDLAAQVNLLLEFLRTCITRDRLTAADLLCTFVSRRVLPLQRRSHKIGHMGVASRVNYISNARLPNNWQWGMEPFSRHDLPAAVSLFVLLPVWRYAVAFSFALFSCYSFVVSAGCRTSRGCSSKMATWRRRFGKPTTPTRWTGLPARTRTRTPPAKLSRSKVSLPRPRSRRRRLPLWNRSLWLPWLWRLPRPTQGS